LGLASQSFGVIIDSALVYETKKRYISPLMGEIEIREEDRERRTAKVNCEAEG
jgi:hypothetical protein